jgi:hypothetical protein
MKPRRITIRSTIAKEAIGPKHHQLHLVRSFPNHCPPGKLITKTCGGPFMPIIKTTRTAEGAIWSRLLQPSSKTLSLEAARSLVALDFVPEDKKRMRDLAAKARDGSLTPAEQEEISTYERVGNLLALLKSKARQRLKKPTISNGQRH